LKFELAPPQKSSKIVDESLALPLHTSKTLDSLHKLLPLLLHTMRKQNDKKKTKIGSLTRGPRDPAVFFPKNALFSAFLRAFFKVLKSARFFLVKSGALKNARFIRFLPFKRRFLLLGFSYFLCLCT
jgi:hypothetical protein